jgi:ADP-ribose pyrophosphatase
MLRRVRDDLLPSVRAFGADDIERLDLAPAACFLSLTRASGTFGYKDSRVAPNTIGHDGAESSAMAYEVVGREAMDAVVVVAYFDDESCAPTRRYVYLRESSRVPLLLRDVTRTDSSMWELCAGLIEPGENIDDAALREAREELGADASRQRLLLEPLGPWVYPAPGVLAERQFFFALRLDPSLCQEALGDGSGFEQGARVITVPLVAALAECARGNLRDGKTELGLRRLAELNQ